MPCPSGPLPLQGKARNRHHRPVPQAKPLRTPVLPMFPSPPRPNSVQLHPGPYRLYCFLHAVAGCLSAKP